MTLHRCACCKQTNDRHGIRWCDFCWSSCNGISCIKQPETRDKAGQQTPVPPPGSTTSSGVEAGTRKDQAVEPGNTGADGLPSTPPVPGRPT